MHDAESSTRGTPFPHAAHLFVPASNPALASKAARSSASAVILDLEDAVAPDRKSEARENLPTMVAELRAGRCQAFVRVNNDDALLWSDVSAALAANADGIVLPMVESTESVQRLSSWIDGWFAGSGIAVRDVALELQIETPHGLNDCVRIAQADAKVVSLMLGVEDFSLTLGIDPNHADADLTWAHAEIIKAAAIAGVAAYGLMGSFSNYRDLERYRAEAGKSRAFGYAGAYCIHPKQAEVATQVYTPSSDEAEHAKRVLAAYEAAQCRGEQATSLDGLMIDKPVADRARGVLARAPRM